MVSLFCITLCNAKMILELDGMLLNLLMYVHPTLSNRQKKSFTFHTIIIAIRN